MWFSAPIVICSVRWSIIQYHIQLLLSLSDFNPKLEIRIRFFPLIKLLPLLKTGGLRNSSPESSGFSRYYLWDYKIQISSATGKITIRRTTTSMTNPKIHPPNPKTSPRIPATNPTTKPMIPPTISSITFKHPMAISFTSQAHQAIYSSRGYTQFYEQCFSPTFDNHRESDYSIFISSPPQNAYLANY